jgi:hypothetical protein
MYGQGNSVGDEAGFIVGMSTCYPKPGSVKIAKDEILTLESNYSSEKSHTGVTGLFYLLVVESSPTLNAWVQVRSLPYTKYFYYSFFMFFESETLFSE